MKLLGLDIGDQWTGIAISDDLHIIASPHHTVASKYLESTLTKLFGTEKIQTVVVGYPITMKGTESDQTRKVVAHKEELAQLFPFIEWVLWDERLSSKQANAIKHAKTKEEKLKQHSMAAALILKSYLDHLAYKKDLAGS
ncbi:MAG: Holliday junction resolvase RuvX [Candidatus Babeliales bacterium]